MNGFLTAGQTKGLAYEHDWQSEIQGLYQREAYASQQRAEAEKKTQYYSQLFAKPANVRSQAGNQMLNSFYEKKMGEIGDFITKNPNFETDIGLMSQLNGMAAELQDNDIVRQELQVEKEYELLKANRKQITPKKWEAEMARYDNWFSRDPNDPESMKAEPYFFNDHLVINPLEIINDAAKSVSTETKRMQINGDWGYGKGWNSESFETSTFNHYSNEDNRHAIDTHFESFDPEVKEKYSSSYDWFQKSVRAQENKEILVSTLDSEKDNDKTGSTQWAVSPFVQYYARNLYTGNLSNMSNPHNNVLTLFNGVGNTMSTRALSENGGANYIDKNGKMVPIEGSFSFKSIEGEGGVRTDPDTGLTYHAVRVRTDSPENADMKKALVNMAFEGKSSVEQTSFGADFSTSRTVRKNQVSEGTIWVPAVINEQKIDAYNKQNAIGGVDQIKNIDKGMDDEFMTFNDWTENMVKYYTTQNNPVPGANAEQKTPVWIKGEDGSAQMAQAFIERKRNPITNQMEPVYYLVTGTPSTGYKKTEIKEKRFNEFKERVI